MESGEEAHSEICCRGEEDPGICFGVVCCRVDDVVAPSEKGIFEGIYLCGRISTVAKG